MGKGGLRAAFLFAASAANFLRTFQCGYFPKRDDCSFSRYPLPLRYIAIIDLAENRDLIHGAQSLAGKILVSKNLAAERWKRSSKTGRMRSQRTVTASVMIARLDYSRQGQMSQRSVEK
jgi:hypothetical protein